MILALRVEMRRRGTEARSYRRLPASHVADRAWYLNRAISVLP